MPIDPDLARPASFPASESSYRPDDAILYHLGIGAGPLQIFPGGVGR